MVWAAIAPRSPRPNRPHPTGWDPYGPGALSHRRLRSRLFLWKL